MSINKSFKIIELSYLKLIEFENFLMPIEEVHVKTNQLQKYVCINYRLKGVDHFDNSVFFDCRNNFYVSTNDPQQNAKEYKLIKDTIENINLDNIVIMVKYWGRFLGSDFEYYSVKFKDPDCRPAELEMPVSSHKKELIQTNLNEHNKWDDLKDIPKPEDLSFRTLYQKDFKSIEFDRFSEDIINVPITYNKHTNEHFVSVWYWIKKRELKSEQEYMECNNYFKVSSSNPIFNSKDYEKIEKKIRNISLENIERIREYIWANRNIPDKYFEVVFKKETSNSSQTDNISSSVSYDPPKIILLENLLKDLEEQKQKNLKQDLAEYKENDWNGSLLYNDKSVIENNESDKIFSGSDINQSIEKNSIELENNFSEQAEQIGLPQNSENSKNNDLVDENNLKLEQTNQEKQTFSDQAIPQTREESGKVKVDLKEFKDIKFESFIEDIYAIPYRTNKSKYRVYIRPYYILKGTTYSNVIKKFECRDNFPAICTRDIEEIKQWIENISLDKIKNIFKNHRYYRNTDHTFYSVEYYKQYKPLSRSTHISSYPAQKIDNDLITNVESKPEFISKTINQNHSKTNHSRIDLNYNKPLFDKPQVDLPKIVHDDPPKKEVSKTKIDLTGVKALRFAGFKENIRYLPVLFNKTNQTFYIRVRYNLLTIKKRKRYEKAYDCYTNFTVASKYPLESFYACIERKIANLSLTKIDCLIQCTEINNEKSFEYYEPQFKNENYFPVWDRQGHALH